MIDISQETWTELNRPDGGVILRPVLRWHHRGGVVELGDRILAGSEPRIAAYVAPFLGPETTPTVVYVLRNDDGALTPADVAGSILRGRRPAEYYGDLIEYLYAVRRADDTEEEIPVHAGIVSDITPIEGRVEITVASRFQDIRMRETSQRWVLNYWSSAASPGLWGPKIAREIAMVEGGLGLFDTPYFDGTWDVCEIICQTLDWQMHGEITPGTRIGDAMTLLAASSGCQITSGEDGRFRISPVFWPGACGSVGFQPWIVPGVFDETNASNWKFGRPMDLGCTQVATQYQGTEVSSARNLGDEAQVGRLRRTFPGPYAPTIRQSALLARIGYEQHASFPAVVSFVAGPRGLIVQLNDRIRAKDPYTKVEATYRVTYKEPRLLGIGLEAVADGHEATVVNGSFATWGMTTWDDASKVFL